jgi:hypothetical protein
MGSFILFVLWMVGLIVISIELWGPSGSVNGNCNLYVTGSESSGPFTQTLAYLEQHSICEYFLCLACWAKCGWSGIEANVIAGQSWTAAWAFMLVGCVFLLWMMIMAYQVYAEDS